MSNVFCARSRSSTYLSLLVNSYPIRKSLPLCSSFRTDKNSPTMADDYENPRDEYMMGSQHLIEATEQAGTHSYTLIAILMRSRRISDCGSCHRRLNQKTQRNGRVNLSQSPRDLSRCVEIDVYANVFRLVSRLAALALPPRHSKDALRRLCPAAIQP